MPTKKTDDTPVYQLKVSLKGSKPPIWRRIQVRGSTTLGKLHQILQVVMGWHNYHLHQFVVDGTCYGVPDPQWDLDIKSERGVRLAQIAPTVKKRFAYEYDFGDDWGHQIVVEKILPPDPSGDYPLCLTGKRACPPEDVGGMWGYLAFLEVISDSQHPERQDRLDWIGGRFDPEAFDLELVNQRLKRLQR